MRHIFTRSFLFLMIALVVVGTSSCREEERGRPLNYEKGTYLGEADTALNSDQLSNLTNRARLQSDY